jgi:hypothetical protein
MEVVKTALIENVGYVGTTDSGRTRKKPDECREQGIERGRA